MNNYLALAVVSIICFGVGFWFGRQSEQSCEHEDTVDVVNSQGELLHQRCQDCNIDLPTNENNSTNNPGLTK